MKCGGGVFHVLKIDDYEMVTNNLYIFCFWRM